MDELAALFAADQAGGFEDGEVLRDGGFRHVEARGDLAGGEAGFCEMFEDGPARRRGKRVENLLDTTFVPPGGRFFCLLFQAEVPSLHAIVWSGFL